MRSTLWKSFERASVSAERSTLCLVRLFYHLAAEEACLKNWQKLEFSCRRRLTRLGPELSIERPAKICPCMPHRYIDFGPKTSTPESVCWHPPLEKLAEMLTKPTGKFGRNVNETHWKNLAEMLTKPIGKLGRNVNETHSKHVCVSSISVFLEYLMNALIFFNSFFRRPRHR